MAGKSGGHHIVCAPALVAVGHLAGDHGGNLLGGHAAALPHAVCLDASRGGNHDHAIDSRIATGFQQQRDIEQYATRATPARLLHESPFKRAHRRMHDGFEALERRRIAQYRRAQRRPVEHHHAVVAPGDRAGKCRGDRGKRQAAGRLDGVDRPVGVEHRKARAAEHAGDGGFPHADAAGQTYDDHARSFRATVTDYKHAIPAERR